MSAQITSDDVALKAPVRPAPATVAARPRRSLRQRLRLPLMLLLPILIAIGVGWFYVTGGRYASTDDAFVQAARVAISTDVSGRVVELDVHNNQQVTPGQLLFKLDARPFEIAVENAKAEMANRKLQVEATKASYRQRMADVRAAQDTLSYQNVELDRQKRLLSSGVTSQAAFDLANHSVQNARSQLAGAQQQIAGIVAQLAGNPDLPADRAPTVQQAQADLDRALLNLSYTVVNAPEEGIVTQVDQLQVGNYVTAAAPVFSLISAKRIWIEANFKETDLTNVRPGQKATVEIDTYPDRTFTAEVSSLSPGTGSTFSVLPPENTSGNWVKVVQRLPVRLTILDQDPNTPLHAGLSATVSIDTGYERPIAKTLHRYLGR